MLYSPKQNRIACVALTLCLLLLVGAASSQPYNFPPRLAPGYFLRDDANLLELDDRLTLTTLQQRISVQTNSSVVVVTIDRMSSFTSQPSAIDAFARAWFNHWAIGPEADNTGMLLLVSREDRQAWIVLGAAWGSRWDNYRERIMRGLMIPAFNKGDYTGGILAGAHALVDMAAQGPQGSVPSLGIVAALMTIPVIQTIQQWQVLSPRRGLLTLLCALISMVGSCVVRRCRGALLLGGFVFLLGGFLPIFFLLLPLIIVYVLFSARPASDHYDHTDGASTTHSLSHRPYTVDKGGLFGGSGGLSSGGGSSGSL